MDEIPVAKRETNPERKISRFPQGILFILVSGLIILVAGWFVWQNNNRQSNLDTSPVSSDDTPVANSAETENDNSEVTEESTTTPETESEPIPENILGHLPYEQASLSELEAVTSDGRVRLRKEAAQKFIQMQSDARRQGVILTALSGFRTVSEQEYLFFAIKAQRRQNASERAKVSAPPGYSEHHTGYAIDIGDGNLPATNFSTSFEETKAFQWLEKNAPRYSFELSFGKDNLQGISYEPWHWRYVGNIDSLKTFYKVHQLKTNLRQAK